MGPKIKPEEAVKKEEPMEDGAAEEDADVVRKPEKKKAAEGKRQKKGTMSTKEAIPKRVEGPAESGPAAHLDSSENKTAEKTVDTAERKQAVGRIASKSAEADNGAAVQEMPAEQETVIKNISAVKDAGKVTITSAPKDAVKVKAVPSESAAAGQTGQATASGGATTTYVVRMVSMESRSSSFLARKSHVDMNAGSDSSPQRVHVKSWLPIILLSAISVIAMWFVVAAICRKPGQEQYSQVEDKSLLNQDSLNTGHVGGITAQPLVEEAPLMDVPADCKADTTGFGLVDQSCVRSQSSAVMHSSDTEDALHHRPSEESMGLHEALPQESAAASMHASVDTITAGIPHVAKEQPVALEGRRAPPVDEVPKNRSCCGPGHGAK